MAMIDGAEMWFAMPLFNSLLPTIQALTINP